MKRGNEDEPKCGTGGEEIKRNGDGVQRRKLFEIAFKTDSLFISKLFRN